MLKEDFFLILILTLSSAYAYLKLGLDGFDWHHDRQLAHRTAERSEHDLKIHFFVSYIDLFMMISFSCQLGNFSLNMFEVQI